MKKIKALQKHAFETLKRLKLFFLEKEIFIIPKNNSVQADQIDLGQSTKINKIGKQLKTLHIVNLTHSNGIDMDTYFPMRLTSCSNVEHDSCSGTFMTIEVLVNSTSTKPKLPPRFYYFQRKRRRYE